MMVGCFFPYFRVKRCLYEVDDDAIAEASENINMYYQVDNSLQCDIAS